MFRFFSRVNKLSPLVFNNAKKQFLINKSTNSFTNVTNNINNSVNNNNKIINNNNQIKSFYTTTTTNKSFNTEIINTIIKSIENQPNNVENYFNLTVSMIRTSLNPNGGGDKALKEEVVTINGKEYSVEDLYLKVIDMDENYKNVYIDLYIYLIHQEKNQRDTFTGTIELLNGKKLTAQELLFKEIENNPKEIISYLELSKYLYDPINEVLEIPVLHIIEGEPPIKNIHVNRLMLVRMAASINIEHPMVIQYVNYMVYGLNMDEFELMDGSKISKREITFANYFANNSANSVIDLSMLIAGEPASKGIDPRTGEQIEISSKSVLLNGIKKFSYVSYFHYLLSTNENIFSNNVDTIEFDDKKLTRLDFMINAILIDESIQLKTTSTSPNLPMYYQTLANFLSESSNQVVEFNNQIWDVQSLLRKSNEFEK